MALVLLTAYIYQIYTSYEFSWKTSSVYNYKCIHEMRRKLLRLAANCQMRISEDNRSTFILIGIFKILAEDIVNKSMTLTNNIG